MSQILDTLVARLRKHTLAELEAIARAAGVPPSLPRKLRSGERPNPTLRSIEPLLAYFNKVDAGLAKPASLPRMSARKGGRHG